MAHEYKDSDILKAINEIGLPVGATYLSKRLLVPPATIGRSLAELDEAGLIKKISNKGRLLTDKGKEFLAREELEKEKEQDASRLVQLITKADKGTMLEILQTRKLLERYTVELACSNATESELNELERLVLEHIHVVRQGGLGSEQDLAIHLAIAKISHNKTIYQILKLMLMEGNVYTKFSHVSDSMKHTQVKQHDAIIQAIQERSVEKAKLALEVHLDQIMEDVLEFFQDM